MSLVYGVVVAYIGGLLMGFCIGLRWNNRHCRSHCHGQIVPYIDEVSKTQCEVCLRCGMKWNVRRVDESHVNMEPKRVEWYDLLTAINLHKAGYMTLEQVVSIAERANSQEEKK